MDKYFLIQGLCLIVMSAGLFIMAKRENLIKFLGKDPIDEIYDAIDHAIKINQKVLELKVNHISAHLFTALYRGLSNQGVKVDCQRRGEQDIMIVLLEEYKGPRNKKLIKEMDFGHTGSEQSSRISRGPHGRGTMVSSKPVKKTSNSFQQVLESILPKKEKAPAKVIDFAEFKRKRQVVIISTPKDAG